MRRKLEITMIAFHIPNITCGGCARGVAAAIREVDGAAKVEADLNAGFVTVESVAAEAALRKALAEAGFSPA